MATVSLQQIIDKLNSEFVIGERRLIFWYDAAQDFFDDIEEIASKLENAELLIMPHNQQFKTKTIIERRQPNGSFLIYSPAPKPTDKLNFLMDELEYSQEFTADRIAFISLELGIPSALRSIVESHQTFFGSKERMQKLSRLNLEYRDEHNLILGMIAVLTNQKTADIETITRAILDGSFDEDNKSLAVLSNYNLLEGYWEEVNLHFGYQSETPNLMQFVSALVLNVTFFELSIEIPSSYKIYRVSRQSTVAVFMANYMNNKEYTTRYDTLATAVYDYVLADQLFGKMGIDTIAKSSAFRQFDERVLRWGIERLLVGDVTAKVNDYSIEQLTDERVKMHFGDFYSEDYHVLKHAAALMQNHNVSYGDATSMITAYTETGFNVDRHYRKFYQHLHAARNRDQYDKLRQLIEETYVKYLANTITQWNKELIFTDTNQSKLNLQRDFYQNYIAKQTANTVIIISDAFRYEAALELADLLKFDTKNIVHVESALTGLPSITPFGMAQLLPHNSLSYDEIGRAHV